MDKFLTILLDTFNQPATGLFFLMIHISNKMSLRNRNSKQKDKI